MPCQTCLRHKHNAESARATTPKQRPTPKNAAGNLKDPKKETPPLRPPQPPISVPLGPSSVRLTRDGRPFRALRIKGKDKAELREMTKHYIRLMFEEGNTLAVIRSDALWEVYNWNGTFAARNVELRMFYTDVVRVVQEMIIALQKRQ